MYYFQKLTLSALEVKYRTLVNILNIFFLGKQQKKKELRNQVSVLIYSAAPRTPRSKKITTKTNLVCLKNV